MASIRARTVFGPETHGGLSFEEPEVARYITIPGSDEGFTIPSGELPLSDRHIQGIHAPGLIASRSAVLFFRTLHRAGSAFSVRLNSTRLFQHMPPEDGAQSWHEIIQPGALLPENNELTLAVASDGQVTFSEIVILYTSNRLTVTKEAVFDSGDAGISRDM